MSNRTTEALHDIHTATNDVLKGYREMGARAEPEIQAVIQRLTELHQRHASEHASELLRLRDSGEDDASLQGTINKVVVVLRDWISDLDKDALPAVRMGEESLRDKYNEALEDSQLRDDPLVGGMLRRQLDLISIELPDCLKVKTVSSALHSPLKSHPSQLHLAIKDKAKDTLYVFLSESGNFIAANHSGE